MGYTLIYERLQRHRDDDERLKIDALMDMPGARARLDESRREAVGAMGLDIG